MCIRDRDTSVRVPQAGSSSRTTRWAPNALGSRQATALAWAAMDPEGHPGPPALRGRARAWPPS
eukprot:2081431-Lingulodinium_polyedra.AAC.1